MTDSACHTCQLVANRDAGNAPLWDSIYRTEQWDVVHSFNTSIQGWMCVVARRHIAAVDEMTDDEAVELGRLIRRVSVLLREATGCLKTYVVQFAEAPGHNHVHFHIIPRMADQADELRGPRIFGALNVPEDQRISEDQMNEIGAVLQRGLAEGVLHA